MKKYIILFVALLVVGVITTLAFHQINRSGIAYAKGHRFFENRMYEQAIPYLEQAVTIRPSFVKAQKDLGLSALWTGRYARAEKSFLQILRIDPENRFALRGMADIEAWTGNKEDAIKKYKEFLNKNPNDYYTILSLANVLFWEKRYDEAIPLYRKFLNYEPTHQESIVNIAGSLIQSGKADEGFSMLASLEKKYPSYPPILKALGKYYLDTKDYTKAMTYYEKALNIDTEDLEATARLVDCMAGLSQWDEALKRIDGAIAKAPNDHGLVLIKGDLLLWSKKYDDSRKVFQTILTTDPEDPAAMKGLIHTHTWQGDFKGALPYIERLETIDPSDTDNMRDLALSYLVSGKYKESADIYSKVLPDSAPPHGETAEALSAYMAAGYWGMALETAKKIYETDPTNTAALNTLIDIAIKQKRLGEAEKLLNEGLVNDPSNSKLRAKLGDIYMWQGRFADAEREYKRALGTSGKKKR